MRGYNELSESEIQAVQVLDMDSLGIEGAEILRSCPGGKAVDSQALHYAALMFQQEGDRNAAVRQYQLDTGRIYLGNAFSLNMLHTANMGPVGAMLIVTEVRAKAIPVCAVSIVGHADTAALFSTMLGREVAFNRTSVTLHGSDTLFVGQYSGPRLPEGATALPDGATVKWLKVTIN